MLIFLFVTILGRIHTFPNVEGTVLCLVISCVDCNWLELCLIRAGGPPAFHTAAASVNDWSRSGCGPEESQGSSHRGHPGSAVEAEVGTDQYVPLFSAQEEYKCGDWSQGGPYRGSLARL